MTMTTSPRPTTVALSILDTVTDNSVNVLLKPSTAAPPPRFADLASFASCVPRLLLTWPKMSFPTHSLTGPPARIAAIKLAMLTIPTSHSICAIIVLFVIPSARRTPISLLRLFVHKKRTSTKIIAEKIRLPRNSLSVNPYTRLIDFCSVG